MKLLVQISTYYSLEGLKFLQFLRPQKKAGLVKIRRESDQYMRSDLERKSGIHQEVGVQLLLKMSIFVIYSVPSLKSLIKKTVQIWNTVGLVRNIIFLPHLEKGYHPDDIPSNFLDQFRHSIIPQGARKTFPWTHDCNENNKQYVLEAFDQLT